MTLPFKLPLRVDSVDELEITGVGDRTKLTWYSCSIRDADDALIAEDVECGIAMAIVNRLTAAEKLADLVKRLSDEFDDWENDSSEKHGMLHVESAIVTEAKAALAEWPSLSPQGNV